MYKKEEVTAFKTQFWSEFKVHMSATRSADGSRMNWLNYPSGIKFIHIRTDADESGARLCFDIQAKDAGVRSIFWEQMQELKIVMESEMGTDGIWIEDCRSAAVPHFSRIMWELNGVSIFHSDDYNEMFTFLEDRLVHFDAFYHDFKDILVNLAS